MWRLLIALILVAGTVLLGWTISRFKKPRNFSPTKPAFGPVPLKVLPPQTPWAILVFTSKACRTCPGVLHLARRLETQETEVIEYSVEQHLDIHRKYKINSVPLTLVVNESGEVKEWCFGPIDINKIKAAISP